MSRVQETVNFRCNPDTANTVVVFRFASLEDGNGHRPLGWTRFLMSAMKDWEVEVKVEEGNWLDSRL